MTRTDVSDLYSFGIRLEMPYAAAPNTRSDASSSHLRCHRIPNISSGVYFRPGNISALHHRTIGAHSVNPTRAPWRSTAGISCAGRPASLANRYR